MVNNQTADEAFVAFNELQKHVDAVLWVHANLSPPGYQPQRLFLGLREREVLKGVYRYTLPNEATMHWAGIPVTFTKNETIVQIVSWSRKTNRRLRNLT